ncbi:MAG: hypothetical protein FWC36_02125 [Spirochaetes bacterium]|nr:hypothetical protein [Spirochaetota bacterium]
MMKKNIKHIAAMALLIVFAALALGSGATAQPLQTDRGILHVVVPPPDRPYDVLSLVFATLVKKTDAHGQIIEITSNEGILQMLLREAHRLGAHDIVNVRVSTHTERTGRGSLRQTREVTTGSAMAIRYRN